MYMVPMALFYTLPFILYLKHLWVINGIYNILYFEILHKKRAKIHIIHSLLHL